MGMPFLLSPITNGCRVERGNNRVDDILLGDGEGFAPPLQVCVDWGEFVIFVIFN